MVRYKARLVGEGFKRKFGIDFFETYFPVSNINSIGVVLSVVVTMGYMTEQLDVDTAFLNSDLEEEVCMEVLYSIVNAKSIMWKLNKAIYDLKQDATAWKMLCFCESGFEAVEQINAFTSKLRMENKYKYAFMSTK